MTYAEAQREIERVETEQRAELETRLADRRGPDGMIPRDDHLTVDDCTARLARSFVLFHRERKRSRAELTLASGHPDGRLRWVGTVLVEGSPQHPRWQARLEAFEPLTQMGMAEDDWWVESFDPTDF